MKSEYELILYFGAFIHLPRLPKDQSQDKPKPQLVRNHGLLWVSANDGRIEGFDWEAQHYTAVQALMARKGWVDINNPETNGNNTNGKQIMVKLVHTSTDQNEFFFPGFIGRSTRLYTHVFTSNYIARYPHPCSTIPKFWTLRFNYLARLARGIHISHGISIRSQRQKGLQRP